MQEIVQVKNPAIGKVPAFREFMERALVKSIWEPTEEVIEALLDTTVRSPHGALHLAVEDGTFKGVAITVFPQGVLYPHPRIMFLYMDPKYGKGLKKALILALVDLFRANHYTKGLAVNATGARDCVYKRAFKAGGKFRRIGSVMEFEVA